MARPHEHLSGIERIHGSGNASDALRTLLHRGLRAMNDKSREERVAQRGTADKLNPHVSDAGKCVRQVVMSLMNLPAEPYTDDSLMNFLVGHAVEEAWAAVLTAAGAEFVREDRVEIPVVGTKVTGRQDFGGIRLVWRASVAEALGLDDLAAIPDGAIVELKSINSRSMSWMLKKGEKGKDEHRRQLRLYLYATGAPVGFLVYLVKDATKGEPILHAWEVEPNDAASGRDLEQLASAYEMASSGAVPPIPEGFKKSAYPCSYCAFRPLCWDEQNLELLLAASIAAKEDVA